MSPKTRGFIYKIKWLVTYYFPWFSMLFLTYKHYKILAICDLHLCFCKYHMPRSLLIFAPFCCGKTLNSYIHFHFVHNFLHWHKPRPKWFKEKLLIWSYLDFTETNVEQSPAYDNSSFIFLWKRLFHCYLSMKIVVYKTYQFITTNSKELRTHTFVTSALK